jgi:amino acid transporter
VTEKLDFVCGIFIVFGVSKKYTAPSSFSSLHVALEQPGVSMVMNLVLGSPKLAIDSLILLIDEQDEMITKIIKIRIF